MIWCQWLHKKGAIGLTELAKKSPKNKGPNWVRVVKGYQSRGGGGSMHNRLMFTSENFFLKCSPGVTLVKCFAVWAGRTHQVDKTKCYFRRHVGPVGPGDGRFVISPY